MILSFDPGVLLLPGECEKKASRRERLRANYVRWKTRNPGRNFDYAQNRRGRDPEEFKRKNRERAKKLYHKNPVKGREASRRWREANPIKTKALKVACRSKKLASYLKRENLSRARRLLKPENRIRHSVRVRVRQMIRSGFKKNSSLELMGCTPGELKSHLESLFQTGMTWGNYGVRGWVVDHIKPCAAHDLTDPEQQRACFHYTNLQPLWAIDNLRKGDKWNPPLTPA